MRKLAIAGIGVVGLIVATGFVMKGQATHSAQVEQAGEVVLLTVEGMTCSGCEAAVKMAAKRVEGVVDATASYENGVAEVTYDPATTNPGAVAVAITENTGYKTTGPDAN